MVKRNRKTQKRIQKRSRKQTRKQTRKQRGGALCVAGEAYYHDEKYNACKAIYNTWPYEAQRSNNWENGWYLYFNNDKNRIFNQNNHIHLLPDGRVLHTFLDDYGDKTHNEFYCVDEDNTTKSQVKNIMDYVRYYELNVR